MARFRVGTTFLGRYTLLGPVGHGGVSVVYRAWDTLRDAEVAIKMLDPALAGDFRARERIRREALITERMSHPSVPLIYDHGDASLGDGGFVAYVVMEFLAGEVLSARIGRGPLPWRDAVHVVATAADVAAVAHRRGVVHRDLTAANIMLSEHGVKVIDFGLALFIDDPATATDPTAIGVPADDVYALGVLLYHLLTGESPYPTYEGGPTASAAMVRWVAPTPVLAVPGLPRDLAELCRHSMAKTPADRPSAARLAIELWSLVGLAPRLAIAATAEPDPPASAEPPGRGAGRHRRRRSGSPGPALLLSL